MKKIASTATVHRFLEALYPGMSNLARVALDEEMILSHAADMLITADRRGIQRGYETGYNDGYEARGSRYEMMSIPTSGRIVHYRLTAQNAEAINRRRTTGESILKRMNSAPQEWPTGAQAHIGNDVVEGEEFAMLIVRVLGDTPNATVNGQVFLDGNDVLWVTGVRVGEGPGTFSWPGRT